jgi:protein-L-isoaspartate(D-aspartate) O-methyltransferase
LYSKTDYIDAYKQKRQNLVNSLRTKGISDERVLNAINILSREKFIPRDSINYAYDDNALPIECGQTISQPYTVAYMTELLRVNEGDKILEIGTGSGYQASVLSLMGAKVFTIERVQQLFESAKKLFIEFKLPITTRFADGTLGWKEFAPYQGIIVTAAAPNVPKTLKNQLAVGGRLVVPVGNMLSQTMYAIERESETKFKEYKTDTFKFVPLVGKEGWEIENGNDK